jgi:hypothetical protein
MPPAFTPETKLPPDVAAVYDDMRRFRAEIEQHRSVIMTTVSELSSNVQRLIDAAVSLKNEHDNAVNQPVVTQPQDDPMLEDLNNRIKAAIDVLTGSPSTEPTRADPVDPNAPVANIP